MNIHEHQAKDLLKNYGANVSNGVVILSEEEITKKIKELKSKKFVVKAQIHAGGRGKAGGVKILNNLEELEKSAKELLGKKLITHQTGPEGREVKRLYVEVSSDIEKEFYLSCLVDRATSKIAFISSDQGGMDIEEVAESTPEKVCKEWIDPNVGLQGFQVRKMAFNLGLSGQAFKNMCKFLSSVYKAYVSSDASLVEINPCLIASDEAVIAVDGKISLDGNGLFRQRDLAEMRDVCLMADAIWRK